MSMFKSSSLTVGDSTVVLYELSAFNRLEYIEFIFEERKKLPDEKSPNDEKLKAVSNLTIHDYAMLVALSLSQEDGEKRPVKDIQYSVLRKFPSEALTRAASIVRELSGMIINPVPEPNEDEEGTDSTEDDMEKY
ncbi:phage minor tail protein domain-containing protein [Raoultella terrigena]|uniref:phage minor tail protein domain-containing protein n=1 Tax=Klebsiella/Raoultella group TaxID=2890311 RepID=UPI001C7F21F5|nr:phage minor tail protein G [Klebsiella oxytoca]MBX4772201.1 phage tail protein [Klebsiella oxytoca]